MLLFKVELGANFEVTMRARGCRYHLSSAFGFDRSVRSRSDYYLFAQIYGNQKAGMSLGDSGEAEEAVAGGEYLQISVFEGVVGPKRHEGLKYDEMRGLVATSQLE